MPPPGIFPCARGLFCAIMGTIVYKGGVPMNEKEVAEIRRRFKPEKSAVTHVRGATSAPRGRWSPTLTSPWP